MLSFFSSSPSNCLLHSIHSTSASSPISSTRSLSTSFVARFSSHKHSFLTTHPTAFNPKISTSDKITLSPSPSISMVFTGLVEEMGSVLEITNLTSADGGVEMTIQAALVLEDVKIGDSIACNGTCLTVTEFTPSSFKVGLAPETLRRTSLGDCKVGSKINLERSLQANGRMGGHIVQGHVDGTGVLKEVRKEKDAIWFTIHAQPDIMKYVVTKGYICIDGTSLTVCDVYDDAFTFMMVPHTQNMVVMPLKQIGDRVNIEVDITGKYIEKFLLARG